MQETGKENAKQDRKNNKKKWMILAVCAFAAAILLIGFIAGTWWMEKKAEQEYLAMQGKNAEKRQKVPEEEKKIDIPVDFDSLQKENPDIYAWITIPDTVAELYIPRFTLQPLVENAIKHGMISPDDPFAIDLEIFIREHTLHIRIGNDGTRISLEQMKKLLDFDASRQELLDFDQKSYGVQNIQRRIQILCGISYGLSYEIRNNRTWCDLTLPVLEHDPSEKTEDLQ